MHTFLVILPYVISVVTVYSMWLAGNKDFAAWPIAIVNQALWLFWIVLSGTWGLLPMNIALWIIFYRNYRKWTAL